MAAKSDHSGSTAVDLRDAVRNAEFHAKSIVALIKLAHAITSLPLDREIRKEDLPLYMMDIVSQQIALVAERIIQSYESAHQVLSRCNDMLIEANEKTMEIWRVPKPTVRGTRYFSAHEALLATGLNLAKQCVVFEGPTNVPINDMERARQLAKVCDQFTNESAPLIPEVDSLLTTAKSEHKIALAGGIDPEPIEVPASPGDVDHGKRTTDKTTDTEKELTDDPEIRDALFFVHNARKRARREGRREPTLKSLLEEFTNHNERKVASLGRALRPDRHGWFLKVLSGQSPKK